MKKLLTLVLVFSISTLFAQDITNTLGSGGKYIVKSSTDEDKLIIDGDNSQISVLGGTNYSIESVSASSLELGSSSIYHCSAEVTSCTFADDAASAPGRKYTIYKSPGDQFVFASTIEINGVDGTETPTTAHGLEIVSDGTKWIARTIGGFGLGGSPSDYLSNVRKVNITADGESFSFLEDDFLIHLTGEDKKITCNLPNAALMPRRIFNLSIVEEAVRDMHITFNSAGGNINGVSTISKEFHHGDIGYIYIYNDGTDWWILAFDNQHKVESEPAAATDPVVFNESGVIENQGRSLYLRVNFTSDTQTIELDIPPAFENTENKIIIKRNADGLTYPGGNNLILKASSGETIDSFTQLEMPVDFESITLMSDGLNWFVINSYVPVQN